MKISICQFFSQAAKWKSPLHTTFLRNLKLVLQLWSFQPHEQINKLAHKKIAHFKQLFISSKSKPLYNVRSIKFFRQKYIQVLITCNQISQHLPLGSQFTFFSPMFGNFVSESLNPWVAFITWTTRCNRHTQTLIKLAR